MSSASEFPPEATPAFVPGRFAVAPGPVASPDELAAVVTWLLSDDASNVNGAVVASDGGWSAI